MSGKVRMRTILYFGQGPKAAKTLQRINQKNDIFKVIGVVPRSKFISSGNKEEFVSFDDGILQQEAEDLNLKVFLQSNINSPSFIEELAGLDIDLFVNYGHGQLFNRDLLNVPKYGVLNFHPGLFPYGRGSGAIVGEIINGAHEIGRTCHLMDENFDSGRIVLQEAFNISPEQTMGECAELLNNDVPGFIIKAIEKVFKEKNFKQIEEFGRYYPKFVYGDEYIDWNDKAINIFRKVQSRIPERYARTYLKESLKEVQVAGVSLDENIKPYISVNGQIIDKSDKGVLVKCADTALWITEIIEPATSESFRPKFKIGTCFQTVNISDFIHMLKFVQQSQSLFNSDVNTKQGA